MFEDSNMRILKNMQKYLGIFLREKKKTNKFATRSHKTNH